MSHRFGIEELTLLLTMIPRQLITEGMDRDGVRCHNVFGVLTTRYESGELSELVTMKTYRDTADSAHERYDTV